MIIKQNQKITKKKLTWMTKKEARYWKIGLWDIRSIKTKEREHVEE